MRARKVLTKLLFALAALAVFFFSYYLGNRYAHRHTEDLAAFVFDDPQRIQPFRLIDKGGFEFTQHDFTGFWSLVMAGNLENPRCEEVLKRYVLAWNLLAVDPKLQRRTRVVFIDTSDPPLAPATLRKEIDFYNPRFTAAGGAARERNRLLRQLGIARRALEHGIRCDSQNTVVALIDPQGDLLALFTGITDPAIIARDLRFLQQKSPS